MNKGRPRNYYALYRGDELLGIGTKEELAKQFGIKVKTIEFYHSPAYKRRGKNSNNRLNLIKID